MTPHRVDHASFIVHGQSDKQGKLPIRRTYRLAIVIPCLNEERYVGDLLQDIVDQSQPVAMVVVADSASTDRTVKVAARFAKRLPLKLALSAGRSPAAARNVGAKLAVAADYLIFIDADMRLPPDFVQQLQFVLARYPADSITPHLLSDGKSALDAVVLAVINRLSRHSIMRRQKAAGIGGVMIIRQSLHEAVGGFPEHVVHDDKEYMKRLNEHQASAHYAPTITAVNSSRRTRQDGLMRMVMDFVLARHRLRKRPYGHYRD